MKISALLFGSLVACASFAASATDDLNRTVASVGVQNGIGAYARFVEPTSANCLYGVVYLGGMDQPNTRGMVAILLAAKAADGKIGDIAYDVQSNGTCFATKVENQ
jgi:hypothetical protein